MLPEDFGSPSKGDAGLHPFPHTSQTTEQTQAHTVELFMKFGGHNKGNNVVSQVKNQTEQFEVKCECGFYYPHSFMSHPESLF